MANAPESRTRDLEEKKLGLNKGFLQEFLYEGDCHFENQII